MASPPASSGKRKREDGSDDTQKKFKSTYNSTITVVVGTEMTEFIVHKDLICDRSPFFRAACSKGWVEAQEKKVPLPDHEANAFKVYLEWAYTQTRDLIGLVHAAIEPSLASISDDKRDQVRSSRTGGFLCELWIMADYLGDFAFKNGIMDCLASGLDAEKLMPSAGATFTIFMETGFNSKLQCWAADASLAKREGINTEWFLRLRDRLPPEVKDMLVMRLLAQRENKKPTKRSGLYEASYYHEHGGDAPQHSTGGE